MQTRLYRVEQCILFQAALLVSIWQQAYGDGLAPAYAYGCGGTVAKVDDPLARTAVVDFYNYL